MLNEKNILLAPNGKPSNLTPEQWHLVRRPNFISWFGDWYKNINLKQFQESEYIDLRKIKSNIEIPLNIKDDNSKLKNYFNKIFNNTVVESIKTGLKITISNRFVKKTLQYNARKIYHEYISFIKEILKQADFICVLDNYSTNKFKVIEVPYFYYFLCGVYSLNGEYKTIFIEVEATRQHGLKLYDIKVYDKKKSELINDIRLPKHEAITNSDLRNKDNTFFTVFKKKNEIFSKVLDFNGEPQVVFHGTSPFIKNFYKFNPNSHFGTKESALERGRKLYEVFLNIKNPYNTIDRYQNWTPAIKEAKENNFDGIIYNNMWEGSGISYVAFHPKQIKLADGSNITFDINNPDIRFDKGGKMNSTTDLYLSTVPPEEIGLENGGAIDNKYFDTSKTDMPYYDNMLQNPEYFYFSKDKSFLIINLTPSEYLEKSALLHNTTVEKESLHISQDNLNELMAVLKSGKKLPMLMIDYSTKSQEGRHRAIVAQRLGVEKVPIMMIFPVTEEQQNKKIVEIYFEAKKLYGNDTEKIKYYFLQKKIYLNYDYQIKPIIEKINARMENGGKINIMENKTIEQKAEERVEKAQEHKVFKDTSVVKYTRKYQAALDIVTSKDLSELEKDKVDAYKKVEKAKVWQKFDIEAMKAEGYSSGYCYFITKLRESLTNKPYNDERARKMYVITVETLLPIIKEKRDVNDLKEALYDFYRAIGSQITTELKDLEKVPSWVSFSKDTEREPLVEKVLGKTFINFLKMRSDSAKNHLISAYLYNEFTQEQRDKVVQIQKEKILKIKENFMQLASEYREAIKNVSDISEKKKIFNQKFDRYYNLLDKMSYEEFETKRIQGLEKSLTEIENNLSKIYTARPEKWDWYYNKESVKDDKPKDTPRYKSILEKYGLKIDHKVKPLSHIKRTNGLKLPEIAVDNVVKLFGFKDVVYGNYVRDKESEAHTRYFISAILDMAEILNMDIKLLNSAGGLSIFFGALGCGMFSRAFACYYADRKAINLTKKNGDGTVAHEWGHYFDNICSEGTEKQAIPTWATELKKIYLDNAIIKSRFQDIINFWNEGLDAEPKTMMKTFYGIENETSKFHLYGENIDEAIEGLWKKYPRYKNYYEVMADKQMREYFSYLALKFGTLDETKQGMQGGKVFKLQIPLEYKSSYFKLISKEYDINVGKEYYTEKDEMFARCFEAYISYKMQKRNIENNYLVEYRHNYTYFMSPTLLPENLIPYPYGAELIKIVELYDALMATIKKEFLIADFTWDIENRESQYIEIENLPTLDKSKKAVVVESQSRIESPSVENTVEVASIADVIPSETVIEHQSPVTEKNFARIEILKEMIMQETDTDKIKEYNTRIGILQEEIEKDQATIAQSKAESEVEIEKIKDEVIETTNKLNEQPVTEEVKEKAATEEAITSSFKINNVENNQQAEKTNIFKKELNYDTRKVINRAEDVKIEKETIEKIENEGVTIEFLESLKTPIYKYRTQITLHGDFTGVEREVFGRYKILILNQNNTLGVKYVGIDMLKKNEIKHCMYLAGSEWGFNMDSRGTKIQQMYVITKENLDEIKKKCSAIFNSIPDIFVGDKYFNIINIPMYGTFAVISITLNAIYDKNLWQFISFVTNNKISSEADKLRLEEQAKAKSEAEELIRKEEREAEYKKQSEITRPLIEKLKNSCTYPVLSNEEVNKYKKYILAKVVREGYGDNISVKIVVYYIEKVKAFGKLLFFKRYINDWNEISLSFDRTYSEKRKEADALLHNMEKSITEGAIYLAWFEPLVVKEIKHKAVNKINSDKPTYMKPKMNDVKVENAEYSIIKSKHTKTGADIWILKLKTTLDANGFNEFRNKMKAKGGYYSSFVKGFVFNNEPNI